jgi:uncharacterized membrane protein YidH (DUF202 family)
MRNLALIESHHAKVRTSGLKPRPMTSIWLMLAAVCVVVLAVLAGLVVLLGKVLDRIMQHGAS